MIRGDTSSETNITPIFKKHRKEHRENFRPINLTSVPRKVLEKSFLETIPSHMKEEKERGNSQHGFTWI